MTKYAPYMAQSRMMRQASTDTQQPTLLGTLGKLPLEVRHMVYVKCHMSLRILRVNTMIYSEYLESLQRVFKFGTRKIGVLRLYVDPSQHPSTVQILTEYGRLCGSINAASPHLQFDTNPIRSMPIGLYNRLELTIEPPNPDDPGQAIRLCKQITAVVTSLSACWFPSTASGIPSRKSDCLFPSQMKYSTFLTRLTVIFKESPNRSWVTNGEWNKSLPDYDEGWYDERLKSNGNSNTDIGLVLQILQQLRGVHFSMHRPAMCLCAELFDLHIDIGAMSEMETHFGLNWRSGFAQPGENGVYITSCPVRFSDHRILEKIQSLQIWHEYLLDDLPGRSANLLRQERFLNWCNAYECQHSQALYGIPPRLKPGHRTPKRVGIPITGAHEWIYFDLFKLIESSFHSRFWAMMACDLNKPTGVERKSKNKSWTEFPERPLVVVHPMIGFYVSLDEPWSRRWKWTDAVIKCRICEPEKQRTRRVYAQRSVRKMIEVLSTSSGL